MSIEFEKAILDKIVDIHNDYCSGTPLHPMESGEWCTAIHNLQRIIATRIATKEHPEIFKQFV